MLRCSISNSTPAHPVAAIPTGLIYERSTIETAILQTGKCPVTGVSLKPEDLVDIKSQKIEYTPPRASDGSSIPALLSAFQNEWDSVMLENFKLRQTLDKTRKELAHSLYQHDAACRVIARLVKERDAARFALSTTTSVSQSSNEVEVPASKSTPATQSRESSKAKVNGEIVPFSQEEQKKINEVSSSLQASRSKKRKSSASAAQDLRWEPVELFKANTGLTCLDVDEDQAIYAIGTQNGEVSIISRLNNSLLGSKQVSGPISKLRVIHDKKILVVSEDSKLQILNQELEELSVSTLHGPPSDCCIHATKEYSLTSDLKGNWYVHRLETGTMVSSQKAKASSLLAIASHPDGIVVATSGESDGSIDVWDMLSGKLQATLEGNKKFPTSQLSFCENGVSLASCSTDDGVVKIWDMRKPAAPVETLKGFHFIAFDPLGQNFVSANSNGAFQVRNVVRTGAWPVSFKSDKKTQEICAISAGKGSLVVLHSSGIVAEWR